MPTATQTANQRSFAAFVKDPPLLVAQQANLSHTERLDTLDLTSVNRKVADLDVARDVVSANVTLTIAGASTLTVGIHDPKWKIERSGLLDRDANGRLDDVAVALDSLRWRLAKAARNDATTLTLTFEDEVWALLRAHRKHLATSRNALTRAQFIELMVREVKLRTLVYYSPEKGAKQPITHPDFPNLVTTSTTKGTFDEKRWAAAFLAALSIDQTPANMQAVIGWERAEGGHWHNNAKYNPINTTQRMPGSSSMNSVGVQAYTSWAQGLEASVKTIRNGHYPAILSALRGNDPAAVANAIGSSPWGTNARLIHSAISGAPGNLSGVDGGPSTNRTDATHEAVRVKSYRFTRGLPGQAENSAQAAVRLADEVAWRFYAIAGAVFFVSDYYLIAQAADLVLDGFDAPGLLGLPMYEWDHRKPVANVTLPVAANAWGVAPGSCVTLNDMGPITGRWIVETFEFDLFNADVATVTLVKPTKPKPEPAPDVFTVTVDSTGKVVRDTTIDNPAGPGGYVHPMGSGLTLGRTDMGVDFAGSGDIRAIGRAKVTRVSPQGSGTGWPGAGDGGRGNRGAMIVYELLDGSKKGKFVYLAENIDAVSGLTVGKELQAGEVYAHARGQFPYLEIGWAANAQGTTLASATTGYSEGQQTVAGKDFLAFINSLKK